MGQTLKFFQSKDNFEDIVLLEGDTVVDSSTITSIAVNISGTIINSTNNPTAFVFPKQIVYEGNTVNGIRMNLALPNTVSEFNEPLKTTVTIFSAGYPNGIVWENDLITVVKRPYT